MKKIIKHVLLTILMAVLAALILKPYLHPGFPYTHDGENHLARFANYKIALKEGQIPPRFAPNLMNHYGYPVFNYNYPLANIASLPCSILKCNYELNFKLIMAAAVMLGLWGVERWLNALGFGFRPKVFGLLAFASTPYLFAAIAYRGNIGEVMAFGLLPWLAASIEVIGQRSSSIITRKQLGWWLLLWTAFLLSHNVMVMFGLPLVLIYALLRLGSDWGGWKVLGLIVAGAVGLSWWFWLPAVAEKSLVIVGEGALSQNYLHHFSTLQQLLFSPLSFGFSWQGSVDSLSFNLGLVQWLGLGMAILLLLKNYRAHRRHVLWLWLSLGCLLLILFQLKPSSWLWQNLPLVRYIQFPWRLTMLFNWLIVPVLAWLYSRGVNPLRGLLVGLVLLQLMSLVRVKPVDFFHRTNQDYDAFSQSTTTQNENLPTQFSYTAFSQQWQPTAEVLAGEAELKILRWSGSNHDYLVTARTPVTMVEPTMFFAGWETTVKPDRGDSYRVPNFDAAEVAGRVAYQLPAGKYQITSSFTQKTWPRMVGNAVTLLTLTALLIWGSGWFSNDKLLGLKEVALWRVGLFLLAWIAPLFLIYQPSFPYAAELLQTSALPSWVYSWANFDGVHYLTIIARGYVGTGLIQAFFPLYPLLISAGRILGLHPILIGLAVSFVSTVWLVQVWQKLLQLDYDQHFSRLGSLVLLLFPTSLFLAGLYTESLFLLLVLASFWFARTQRWWLAGLVAAGAAATRITGVLLVPALIVELAVQTDLWARLKQHSLVPALINWVAVNRSKLLAILTGSIGLILFMVFLYREFGDPLYFYHVQDEFGGGRQTNLVFYPQVVWRYVKIMATATLNLRYLIYLQEFLAGVIGLALIIWSFWKTRLSYATFALLAFLLPTLTGTFSSLPRYIAVSFVIYIIITDWLQNHPYRQAAWFLLSTGLLIFNTILFIQGYWVA